MEPGGRGQRRSEGVGISLHPRPVQNNSSTDKGKLVCQAPLRYLLFLARSVTGAERTNGNRSLKNTYIKLRKRMNKNPISPHYNPTQLLSPITHPTPLTVVKILSVPTVYERNNLPWAVRI